MAESTATKDKEPEDEVATTKKESGAAGEPPEGLSKDEVQAWKESLPEPAEEIKSTSRRRQARRGRRGAAGAVGEAAER